VAADRAGLGIVAAHHYRKGESEDFVEAMSGSFGLTGTVDTVIGIKRPRTKPRGSLQLTARDGAELDWVVNFDGGEWSFVADASEAPTESDRDLVDAVTKLELELNDGPVPAKIARANMGALGIGGRLLKATKKELGVVSYQQLNEETTKREWLWRLPEAE